VKLASETTWSEVRDGFVAAGAVGSTTREAATTTAISIVRIARNVATRRDRAVSRV